MAAKQTTNEFVAHLILQNIGAGLTIPDEDLRGECARHGANYQNMVNFSAKVYEMLDMVNEPAPKFWAAPDLTDNNVYTDEDLRPNANDLTTRGQQLAQDVLNPVNREPNYVD